MLVARHAAGMLLWLAPLAVLARERPRLRFSGDGQCPAAGAVAAELKELQPGFASPAGEAEDLNPLEVQIFDLGPRYRVSVAGETRELADGARECLERARAAASFVLLVLEPPAMPQKLAGSRVHPAAPHVDLELLGAIDGAPRTGADNGLITGGGGLRLALAWRYVGASLGAAGLSPDALRFGAVAVRLMRLPLDLSARGALRRRSVEGIAELGLALSAVRAEGLGLAAIQSGWRLEPGVRAALGLRIWPIPRLGITAGFDVVAPFQTTPLAVVPVGIIGATPSVWLGARVGLAVRLH
jgi:hypothetical protein